MKLLIKKHKLHWTDRRFIKSAVFGIFLFIVSLIVNYGANYYAFKKMSNSVSDIILSNIRVFDIDAIFVYGPVVFFIFLGVLCVTEPKRFPFLIKSIALFVLIRSIFITLTHLAPFPTQNVITSVIFQKFSFGPDLFFSAHAGLPFLMALAFWSDRRLRYLFIATSVFFGAIVLMGHMHYTIDVLAAFFITYTIFHIAEKIFRKDHRLLREGVSVF